MEELGLALVHLIDASLFCDLWGKTGREKWSLVEIPQWLKGRNFSTHAYNGLSRLLYVNHSVAHVLHKRVPSCRCLAMNAVSLRFSNWIRCLCIQPRKLYGMKTLSQLSTILGKVGKRTQVKGIERQVWRERNFFFYAWNACQTPVHRLLFWVLKLMLEARKNENFECLG